MYDCLPMYHTAGGVVRDRRAAGRRRLGGASAKDSRRANSGTTSCATTARSSSISASSAAISSTRRRIRRRRAHQLRLACGNGLRPDVWARVPDALPHPADPRILRRDRRQRVAVQLRRQARRGRPRAAGSSRIGSRPRSCASTSSASSRCATPTGFCIECAPDEVGEVVGKIVNDPSKPGQRFEGYADQAETEKKILRDVFEKGDAWFRTGDLMRQDARRLFLFRRPHRRHLPLEGRERVDHRRSRRRSAGFPGVARGQRLRRRRSPAATAAPAWRRSWSSADFDLAALRDHLARRLPDYARPLFLRIRDEIEVTAHLQAEEDRPGEAGLRSRRRHGDPIYFNDPRARSLCAARSRRSTSASAADGVRL